jgi:hypothetical protein
MILDGSTGDYSSELPPPVDNWSYYHRCYVDFFVTHGQDGNLRIFTVFDDTINGGVYKARKVASGC